MVNSLDLIDIIKKYLNYEIDEVFFVDRYMNLFKKFNNLNDLNYVFFDEIFALCDLVTDDEYLLGSYDSIYIDMKKFRTLIEQEYKKICSNIN